MGNYKVEIEGLGAHGNVTAGDADRIMRRAVETLRCHQHSLTKATFTCVDGEGNVMSSENLLEPAIDAELQVENAMPEHIMQFFAFEHLPPHLKAVSAPFADMAKQLLELPRNPERTVALRKLLESKDAAVRARVAK